MSNLIVVYRRKRIGVAPKRRPNGVHSKKHD
jgi:hypothetical protein